MSISAENVFFDDFLERWLVRFGRCGKAAVGEPRHVCRHYTYPSMEDASRAFWNDAVGDGRPVDEWKAPIVELGTRR